MTIFTTIPPTSTATSSVCTGATEEEDRNELGLSASAHAKLLCQCGLAAGEEDQIPNLWKIMAEKKLKDTDKKSAFKLQLGLPQNRVWKEAKVRPLDTLVKMVIKREFEEEIGLSSLVSAAKGLTYLQLQILAKQLGKN